MFDYEIAKERMRDFQREAARERLAHEARGASRPNRRRPTGFGRLIPLRRLGLRAGDA